MKNIFKIVTLITIVSLSMFSHDIKAKAIEDTSLLNDFSSMRYIGYEPNQSTDSMLNFYSSNNSYPSSYDMRTLGLVSSTKSQGSYGTCWAFTTVETALSGILFRNPFENLSEWHLAYFTYTGNDAIELHSKNDDTSAFYKGGNSAFATTTLSKWIGFVPEDIAPYGSSATLDNSIKDISKYHLTDAYSLNGAFSSKLDTLYNMNDIKQSIIDGHSVTLNLYFNTSNEYYSTTDYSFYYPNSDQQANHEVTIVGWDDNFYSYNGISTKPKNKGAWLVKNSWGYEFGNYGYCWISYENSTMKDATSFIVQDANNFSNNYYLDDYGWTTSINSLNEDSNSNSDSIYYDYASNIFTSQSNEDICAISIYTTDYNSNYTIDVYTNLKDSSNPTSGNIQSSISGNIHQIGYHTINLDTPVSVDTGERYSIVVKLSNPNYKNTIAIESSISFFNVQNGIADIYSYTVSKENLLKNASSGDSFVSNDGSNWIDTYGITGIMTSYDTDFNYKYTPTFDISTLDNGNYAISILGNVCIKSFTKAKDKIDFSQYGGNLNLNDTIELSNHNGYTIYYTLDGSTPTTDSLIYTQPIKFTGKDLTIKARTFNGDTLGSVYTQTFKQSKAVISTLCIKEFNGKDYTFTNLDVSSNYEPITDINFKCKYDTTSINIYSIGNGDILISNDSVISGQETQSIPVDNTMTIPIDVSNDGMISTKYTLHIAKNILGDITLDGLITSKDMLVLKKYLLNISAISKEQISNADTNLDGIINLLDLLYLKSLILNNT